MGCFGRGKVNTRFRSSASLAPSAAPADPDDEPSRAWGDDEVKAMEHLGRTLTNLSNALKAAH